MSQNSMCSRILAPPEYTGKRCCCGRLDVLVGLRSAVGLVMLSAFAHLGFLIAIIVWRHDIMPSERRLSKLLIAILLAHVAYLFSGMFVFIGIRWKQWRLLYPFIFLSFIIAIASSLLTVRNSVLIITDAQDFDYFALLSICMPIAYGIFVVWFMWIACCGVSELKERRLSARIWRKKKEKLIAVEKRLISDISPQRGKQPEELVIPKNLQTTADVHTYGGIDLFTCSNP